MAIQVQCINKTNRSDPHDRIHAIGGVANGTRWKLTEQQAIADIEAGKRAFYVQPPGRPRADVIVAVHVGRKYLKTIADGLQPNNLLALPECA